MQYEIDCHSHSFYSPDAAESPELMFKKARIAGLKGLVITDHNTTAHFPKINKSAKKNKLITCEGIEITASYKNADIHILGYSNSFDVKYLEPLLKSIRNGYNKRSKKTLIRLKKIGIEINFSDLLKKSRSGYVSKPLIAKEISRVKKIEYKSALLLVERGGAAYVPYGVWAPSPEKVVECINKAGGKAVFAHPGDFFGKRNSLPLSKREVAFNKLIKSLIKAGLSGIEVWYPTHTPKQIVSFKSITKKYNIIPTGGSDWHGKAFTPNRSMGQCGTKINYLSKLLVS
ncbi:MAG: PHP domain-containing protein [Candidatus Pacebacteria bacterium]|nr:PHP domain-containing protein [Candidatus Paceibacterota bacterium]